MHLATYRRNPTQVTADGPASGDETSSPETADTSFHATAIAWEEAHWKKYHATQSYAKLGGYDRFREAYRAGFMGYFNLGIPGIAFEDNEPRLREAYEADSSNKLPWELARSAMQAAWARLTGPCNEEMRA